MKTLKRAIPKILSFIIWTAFVGYGFINGFLLRAITTEDTPEAFIEATQNKIADEFVGNLALVLIEDGEISKEYFYSIDKPIHKKSVFPVASISKWLTSFGILKLVSNGTLDLDRPIDDYLTRWHLPPSEFDNRNVTIRRLLSHSSGLVDDLGYSGFAAEENIQTIEESLTQAVDSPYSEGIARIGYDPGSQYMYSGAGYTLLQLLIEEVSGQSFQEYMAQEIFEPLEMNYSTFVRSEKSNLELVPIYKDDGIVRPPRKFTALAAASLFTCTEDLSKFLKANVSSNPVLSKDIIAQMSLSETFINQTKIYGLGPHLYSQDDTQSNIIGHDGSGNNALNTAARIDLESKNGIIILATGHHHISSSLADEWMYMKAGIADYVVMQRNIPYLLKLLILGYLLILLFSFIILRKLNK